MAIRNIIKEGDPILTKVCRKVEVFDKRLAVLIDDMFDTLAYANGAGLAASQVGILRRVVVIDTGEQKLELVNPEIIKTSGVQEEVEGCLSCPGEYGITKRPMYVKVRAQNRAGQTFTAEGEALLARAFCHEIDHLDGIIFKKVVLRMLKPEEIEGD
ncbi:MAG: peptide deformylase [Bacillota bacterium]|nr:peptide deformylase [Bacillota bacterium]